MEIKLKEVTLSEPAKCMRHGQAPNSKSYKKLMTVYCWMCDEGLFRGVLSNCHLKINIRCDPLLLEDYCLIMERRFVHPVTCRPMPDR
jgi:hypothetical protein